MGIGNKLELENLCLTEDEQLFVIPNSWVWTKIGNVIKITGGSQPPKKVFIHEPREGYTRLVQIRDFKSDNHLTFIPDEYAKRPFSKDDIMIGRYGPPVFQILRGLSGTYNVALMKAESDILTKNYMYYLLQASFVQNPVIKDSQRSAGQSGVRRDLLEALPIPIPPKGEQDRIASRLESSNLIRSQIKQKIIKAKQLLNLHHEALLKKAFVGELVPQTEGTAKEFLKDIEEEINRGKKKSIKIQSIPKEAQPYTIPETWEWVKLEQLGLVNPRTSELEEDVEVSFIPMSDVDDEGGSYQGNEIKFWKDVKKGYTHTKNGDVIFAKITPCMQNGKSAVLNNLKNGYGAGSTEFHVFRSYKIIPEYIHAYLRQKTLRNWAENNMTGSAGQKRVPTEWFKNVPIPVPPLNEQINIINKLEQEFEVEKEVFKLIEKAEAMLEDLGISLLNKAFRGELVEQKIEEGTGLDLLRRLV
jgi:type I restriction enzyme, S subunit